MIYERSKLSVFTHHASNPNISLPLLVFSYATKTTTYGPTEVEKARNVHNLTPEVFAKRIPKEECPTDFLPLFESSICLFSRATIALNI